MTPGQLIKKHRQKLGMTQLELANQLGYGISQFISILEHGRSSVPLDKCKKLISVLQIKPKEMSSALMKVLKEDIDDACGL